MGAIKIEDLPHYTYSDYCEWEGRWEVIGGVPFAMSPAPTGKHQRVSQRIAFVLEGKLENCKRCRAYLPVDWRISDDTIVQPDNLVICDEMPWDKVLDTTPSIIFEVISRSSAHKDRVIKYELYEKAGVTYYCLVYPDTEIVQLFELKNGRYEKCGEFKNASFGFKIADCEFVFEFGRIWK